MKLSSQMRRKRGWGLGPSRGRRDEGYMGWGRGLKLPNLVCHILFMTPYSSTLDISLIIFLHVFKVVLYKNNNLMSSPLPFHKVSCWLKTKADWTQPWPLVGKVKIINKGCFLNLSLILNSIPRGCVKRGPLSTRKREPNKKLSVSLIFYSECNITLINTVESLL